MNPPKYPPAAARAGIQGTVILIIDVDANGNVTNVSVEKSSRNRDLDRAAMDAARKWRFNPGQAKGQKSPAAYACRLTSRCKARTSFRPTSFKPTATYRSQPIKPHHPHHHK